MRRAKIVCTLGPATDSPEQVQALVDAGMNVARINRSHGRAEDQEEVIGRIREAAAASGRAVRASPLTETEVPKVAFASGVMSSSIGVEPVGSNFT